MLLLTPDTWHLTLFLLKTKTLTRIVYEPQLAGKLGEVGV